MANKSKSKAKKEPYTFFSQTTSVVLSYLTLLLVLAILIAALFLTRYIYTWWECGKSYLCRIIDMLSMGYVDEVLFGREVLTRLPALVPEWVRGSAKQDGLALGN